MSLRPVQQEASRPNEYRKAVRRLRSGVPSPSAARLISVGTDKVEEFLYQHEEAWRHEQPYSQTGICTRGLGIRQEPTCRCSW